MIVAVLGVLAGAGGLALGGYALYRCRGVVTRSCALTDQTTSESGNIDTRAIRDVAVVRYDALAEMSGARSFSVALLNAVGDGVIITAINGRADSRTYAKTIERGRAQESLSPEEYRAIRNARLGSGPGESCLTEPVAEPAARNPQSNAPSGGDWPA